MRIDFEPSALVMVSASIKFHVFQQFEMCVNGMFVVVSLPTRMAHGINRCIRLMFCYGMPMVDSV